MTPCTRMMWYWGLPARRTTRWPWGGHRTTSRSWHQTPSPWFPAPWGGSPHSTLSTPSPAPGRTTPCPTCTHTHTPPPEYSPVDASMQARLSWLRHMLMPLLMQRLKAWSCWQTLQSWNTSYCQTAMELHWGFSHVLLKPGRIQKRGLWGAWNGETKQWLCFCRKTQGKKKKVQK